MSATTLLALVTASAGCAGDPDPSPPSGVDGLVVPSPSPDPEDFDADGDVDNPWLALEPGSATTLEGAGGDTVTLAVADAPVEVRGIEAAEVTFTDPRATSVHLLAEDDDGNVWRLDEGGAQAGLVMAATPRYGDGYGTAYAGGEVDLRAEVTALEGDTLEVLWTTASGTEAVATFEEDAGLVRLETVLGAYER